MSTTLHPNVLPYPQQAPDGDGHPHRRAGDGVASRHSVSLVVPAQSEARDIPWVFEQIPRCVDEVIHRSFLDALNLRSSGFEIFEIEAGGAHALPAPAEER
ncbi:MULTISPECIES: hypothetical protein [unclassified Kitasatospora]|uniref:hypothetical protein n=1 Tax=unclassified Kitasatospora TaxID=2633591 RepID=UPI00070992DB|nr:MULTISPECIES: hypothetical protein [unclassified Kitasatospora]KQV12128.1 hypothetical protein ASC99_34740 [Kitasatospora sp. Root107]KRB69289.1 hypothetical protein ASE03_28060 [Kitasatospora sp. Root187]